MKTRKGQKEHTLTDRELRSALGGTDSSTPPVNDGGGQSTDARAVVIEDG
jgi:hypothetical protein